MSWETDYDATSHLHTAATFEAAAATRHALDDDDRNHIMQALGLAPYDSKSRPTRQAMRRTVTTDEVLRLYHNGHTPTAIGRMLGIARSTVWHHLNKGRA